jgi:sporulation protein YlmC with PRC-barrel domain
MLRGLTFAAAIAVTVIGTALAQTTTTGVRETQAQSLTALPQDATTVTNWLEQNVYDRSGKMVGEIAEALVNKNGRIEAFIMSIGGLVGPDGKMGVVIPFGAVRRIEKNGKWFLTMDSNNEALRASTVFKFDRAKKTWIPE